MYLGGGNGRARGGQGEGKGRGQGEGARGKGITGTQVHKLGEVFETLVVSYEVQKNRIHVDMDTYAALKGSPQTHSTSKHQPLEGGVWGGLMDPEEYKRE